MAGQCGPKIPGIRSSSSGSGSATRKKPAPAARSDGARDGDAQRTPVSADGPASRIQPRRIRLLHELQQPQGRRARRESARGVRVSLAQTRAAGARRGTRRETVAPRIGAVFSETPAGKPAQRVGIAAERENSGTIVSRGRVRARASALRREEFRVRRSGEAFELSQIVSSSGRDNRIGYTIALFFDEKENPGRVSGSRPEKSCMSHGRVSNRVWRRRYRQVMKTSR